MLHFFYGTDREKARDAMSAAIKKISKGADIVRISDANAPADLSVALQGGGMFGGKRVAALDNVLQHDEMREIFLNSLEHIATSDDAYFLLEEKPDAATKKQIEKYAESSEKFDAAKKREEGNIFAIANALRRGDKKALWVSLQRELIGGKAPEAIHGVLFWGAKDMLMKSRSDAEKTRARQLVALLAELPHEARRRGQEMEYALERFALSGA